MQDGPVVTFGMGETLFALPVALVQEILDPRPVSRLPNSPPHLLGVIDVRGSSVAVIDLRTLLGEPPRAEQPDTRIMVLQIGPRGGGAGSLQVALRVDRVIEVTGLDDGRLEALAEAAFIDWDQRMVEGIGRRNGTFVAVLRVDGLFDREMIAALAARSAGASRGMAPVEAGAP
jgi:purine-binding chemotaxis protein CheW